MQLVLVASQYEEASGYRILIFVINFCNITLWVPGAVAPFAPRTHGSHNMIHTIYFTLIQRRKQLQAYLK